MTPDQIAELKRIAEAATPGPWSDNALSGAIGGEPDRDGWTIVALTPCPLSPRKSARQRQWTADAAHIAAANPATILALIARIEALEAGLKTAAARFRHYEQLHAAKGSPDGDAKAQNNADMAQMIEALLGDRHD